MAREAPNPMATLSLFADTLEPSVVDRVMRIEPNLSARKGERLFVRTPRSTMTARIGTWFLTTEHLNKGDPADHLDQLVSLALPRLPDLRELFPGLRVDLSLLVFDPTFQPSQLPFDLLERAVKVGELEIENAELNRDFLINADNIQTYRSPAPRDAVA